MTLDEAKELWRAMRRNKGGYCPCCGRWGKDYRRGINHTMAASVVWLSQNTEPGGEFIAVPKHAPRWLLGSNQLSIMKHWDMCEADPSDDPAKKHSGYWRITEKGRRWAMDTMRVHMYIWTYYDKVLDTEGPDVKASECLDRFDYSEIMGASYIPRPVPKPPKPRKPRKKKS